MTLAYYNDNEPYACEWIRNLMHGGLIAKGVVDERSIQEVTAQDVAGFRRVHWFCGIAGWDLALTIARWPLDREVWTGSCPCPPFSNAGRKTCPGCGSKGLRFFSGPKSTIAEFGCAACGWRDARHLWPTWLPLIAERGPAVVFGEQVASPLGREWLAGVRADLEALGYAVGAADLCAAGAGAPNIRQRLWWVGISPRPRPQPGGQATEVARHGGATLPAGGLGGMADAQDADGRRSSAEVDPGGRPPQTRGSSTSRRVGDAAGERALEQGAAEPQGHGEDNRVSGAPSFWSDFDIVWCRDPRDPRRYIPRPIEPGTFPLAHGIPQRVGKLRAYGNAINPWVAAQFITAFMTRQMAGPTPPRQPDLFDLLDDRAENT